MNKITEEELKTIQDQQDKVNQILNRVGYLESQKHGLLHELAAVNKEIEDFKAVLEKEYGAVNISIADGTYTEIEQEEETPVAAV